MYETEANGRIESLDGIPADIVAQFSQLQGKLVNRTVLPWSEHCTECVWPTCYTTCDLYSPRSDGRCRRFVDGMVRIESPTSVNGYMLKIRFKQWGKLWTPASLNLCSIDRASQIEKWDYRLGSTILNMPLPVVIKSQVVQKRYSWKKRQATRNNPEKDIPTALMLECYNPSQAPVDLSLTIRPVSTARKIPFQKLIRLAPGYQLNRIPFNEISAIVDLNLPFNIEIIPNGFEQEVALYFGLMEFVQEAKLPVSQSPKVKCVVWDLDNTLWHGVLVEDGLEGIQLKEGIKTIVEELDARGILQSISSKNSHDQAVAALEHFGLKEYFLFPQISWNPKSEAMKTIANSLNLGLDTILFVDDQKFEREQVQASCPTVRTLDAIDVFSLLDREECNVPVTSESINRRKMYMVEQERQEIQQEFRDDYKAFLKHCDIQVTISELNEANLERVHELTQRTNQMNFSGNRYDRAVLRSVIGNPQLDAYVLSCEDRFGKYGIVGFAIVDRTTPRLTDLMFSCRIQSKRVEHAFLRSLIRKYTQETSRDFYANYRRTERNAASGAVFQDIGMLEVSVKEGVSDLRYGRNQHIEDDNVIQVNLPEIERV